MRKEAYTHKIIRCFPQLAVACGSYVVLTSKRNEQAVRAFGRVSVLALVLWSWVQVLVSAGRARFTGAVSWLCRLHMSQVVGFCLAIWVYAGVIFRSFRLGPQKYNGQPSMTQPGRPRFQLVSGLKQHPLVDSAGESPWSARVQRRIRRCSGGSPVVRGCVRLAAECFGRVGDRWRTKTGSRNMYCRKSYEIMLTKAGLACEHEVVPVPWVLGLLTANHFQHRHVNVISACHYRNACMLHMICLELLEQTLGPLCFSYLRFFIGSHTLQRCKKFWT